MDNNVTTCFEPMTDKQFFEDFSLDLIAYIEKSPNPAVASGIARCIVYVAQNLQL